MKTIVALLCMTLLPTIGFSQVFATVEEVAGQVTIVSIDGSSTPALVGQQLLVGQSVVTQSKAELHAVTLDHGVIALRENSVFKVSRYEAGPSEKGVIEMSLLKGALRSITGWIGKLNPIGYRITTSTATVGVRGTDHETTVITANTGTDHAGTYDTVYEGATVLRSPQGEVQIQPGQHGFAAHGLAPGMLAKHPQFWERRELILEHRIQARKDRMQERIKSFVHERREHAEQVRAKRANVADEQRESARENRNRRVRPGKPD